MGVERGTETKEGNRERQVRQMFGLCPIEALDKHAGPPASKHTPDSICSREAGSAK